jgi:hypothetical protein
VRYGVWRSLVARFVRDEEVAGSNPVTPTRKLPSHSELPGCARGAVQDTCRNDSRIGGVLDRGVLERLHGLDHVEQIACRIAERTVGAMATTNDVAPRQSAVDAFLDYPDGRRGAFEVTQLATDGGASDQLDSLLSGMALDGPCPANGGDHQDRTSS